MTGTLNLRYAIRVLLKSPGFSLVAVVTLALGIGVNTAMFTLVNSVLLRPLPYRDPGRLAAIDQTYTMDGREAFRAWSYPRFEDFRRLNSSFESVAAFAAVNVSLTGTADPEQVKTECVSSAYFHVLGADAAKGRTFSADEDRTPQAVAVISDKLSRSVMGQTIRLNEIPFTVIGVLPRDFRGVSGDADIWVPMAMAPAIYDNPKRLTNARSYWHQVIGRLRDQVSFAQANAASRALDPEIQKAHPAPGRMQEQTQVGSLLEAKIDPALRRSLLVLSGAVGFVLLVACASLATLLLGRSMARQRETAIRIALGATRSMLIRQFLTESVVLALTGAVAGLAIAHWGVDLAASLKPGLARGFWSSYARAVDRDAARLDLWVVAFTVGISMLTAVLFGLAPAFKASRVNVSQHLHNLRRISLRNALIVAEVALALALLAGAGMMIGSLGNLLHTPVGFAPDRLATAHIDLPARRYKPGQVMQFEERLLAAIPGQAALANSLPLTGQSEATALGIEHAEPAQNTGVHVVSPGYFAVMRIPLRQGRWLTAADRAQSPNVVLINETAARTLFPGENPIGRHINLASDWGPPGELKEIVGVVGDVKYESMESPVGVDVYASYLQYPYELMFIAVRTPGDPAGAFGEIRLAVTSLDRDLPVTGVMPMQDRFDAAASRLRFVAELLGVFAGLAVLLAALGIYGVVSYSVAARTREIGIRMALGARAATVLRSIAVDGLILAVAGVAIGWPLALWSTRALASMLYEVKSGDPRILAAVSTLLVLITLAASYLPARRAARVDPMIALRHE
jgi:putative ABC transport system permease protein